MTADASPSTDETTGAPAPVPPKELPPPRELGGRDGPDPTRYGDWEKNGIAVDF